jgi:hypothetical protein
MVTQPIKESIQYVALDDAETGIVDTVDNVNLQIGNVEDDEAVNVVI